MSFCSECCRQRQRRQKGRDPSSKLSVAMMFWKSSSTSSAASSSTTTNAAASVTPSVALPSYVLSDQRRNELLLAARANRVSWIDGVDDPSSSSSSRGDEELLVGLSSPFNLKKGGALGKHAGTSIPPHCQQALESIATDLHEFFDTLDELKDKIIPNSIITASAMEGKHKRSLQRNSSADGETALQHRTIFQDLYENEALLDKWQRTQGHGITSPVRKKRMTGDDKEMVFLLAFRELITVLKNPKAAELVYQVQSFVKKFDTWDLQLMLRQRSARERPGGYIQVFIDKLVQQLRHNGKLQDLADNQMVFLCGDDEWSEDLLHEVLEAFLMEKVYTKALTPSFEAENEDRILYDRLQSLAFVEFHHLDLPIPETEELKQAWDLLVMQLRQMSSYMSPRRKMDCILRICQELTKLLASQKADGRFPSADEFLPGLIYLLLKANPRELKRNVNYILEYRNPGKLVSEPGYFFTHLVSSVAFLEQVNGSLLTISPEEFEEGLRKSKQQIVTDIETSSPETIGNTPDADKNAVAVSHPQHPSLEFPDVLEVRAKRLAMLACLK